MPPHWKPVPGEVPEDQLPLNCLNRLEVRGRVPRNPGILHGTGREHLPGDRPPPQGKGSLRRAGRQGGNGDLVNGSINLSCSLADLTRRNTAPATRSPSPTKQPRSSVNWGRMFATRQSIRNDRILREFTEAGTRISFCHTRWASVGSISIENCHPVNNAN